jgi:hypothetical protein
MTDQELNAARVLAASIQDNAEPLEGDYAGYVSVEADALNELVTALGPPNPITPDAPSWPPPLRQSKKARA